MNDIDAIQSNNKYLYIPMTILLEPYFPLMSISIHSNYKFN